MHRSTTAVAAEMARTKALSSVLEGRMPEAVREVGVARTALEAADREYAACAACVETESVRLAAIITHLGSAEVSASAPLYSDTLALRELAARDLARERFVFERASGEREDALAALAVRERELSRLRARERALDDRVAALARERERLRETADEAELDELVTTRHVQLTRAVS